MLHFVESELRAGDFDNIYTVRKNWAQKAAITTVEELTNAILRELLADFESRKLTLNDLSNCYVGANLATLKEKCCGGAASVDFDVALKDLEDGDLLSTGPMDVSHTPGIIAVFSKREYAYLTEKGYKAARKILSKRNPPSVLPRVHISGGTFHQSPIGIGSNITQSVTGTFGETPVFLQLRNAISNMADEDDRAKLCAGVEAMERADNTPDYISRYASFMQSAANHMTVIAPFIPALTALLKVVNPIEVVGFSLTGEIFPMPLEQTVKLTIVNRPC